jgi:hypothetical protein
MRARSNQDVFNLGVFIVLSDTALGFGPDFKCGGVFGVFRGVSPGDV